MVIVNKSIESIIQKAKTAFTNTLARTDIMEKTANLGYDQQTVQDDLNLVIELETRYQDHIYKHNVYSDITIECKRQETVEKQKYKDFRKIVKHALNEPEDLGTREILLQGRVGVALERFLIQAKQSYTKAKEPEILAKLAKFNYKEDTFRQLLNGIFDLESKNHDQEIKKGEAQRATKLANDNSKVVYKRFQAFVTAARITLRGEPQKTELLGIPETIKRKKKSSTTSTTTNGISYDDQNAAFSD